MKNDVYCFEQLIVFCELRKVLQDFMRKKKDKTSAARLTGTIEITRSGMAYVDVEGAEADIQIKPSDIHNAMDGDRVLIKIKEGRNRKRVEGVVEEVIHRKQTEFIGKLEMNDHFAFFVPYSDKSLPDFFIKEENLNGAADNDDVVVKLIGWKRKDRSPEGRVLSLLDKKNEVDLVMKEIITGNGFSINFPDEVMAEMKLLDPAITKEELNVRKDFRDVLTLTIDPADAKDFDDALSFRELDNGRFEIGVHIADVSHFVRTGSKLDQEALKRGTSVYLPDRVVPMLPEKISNELCSLRPGEDKYCFSAVFELNGKFHVENSWFGRTVIRSNNRFTYEQVQKIIDSREGTCSHEILLLNKIARQFRERRFKNGAINFSSSEVKFLLDDQGFPLEIKIKESKPSHQLIEEFMLLANREVATYITGIKYHDKKIPFPYRVHDTPDKEKLKPYVAFALKFGYRFDLKDGETTARSFNQLLSSVKGKPEQLVLEQLGIRTMAKAEYSTENIGHYGLAFKNYCHFTSPIRRYPDIMVHRILQEVLSEKIVPDGEMKKKCTQCSERERAAMEAERAGDKFEQVLFMRNKVGEEMEGVISGVASFGFWVETLKEKCEGLVSIRDLSEYDDFRHDEDNYSLVGVRTHRKFTMGDLVKVKLVAANTEKRQLDFEWVSPFKSSGEQKKTRKKR